MKKYVLGFTVLLVLILTACGGTSTPQDNPNDTNNNLDSVTFDITWVDENGTNLSVDAVSENGVVSHTYNPTDTAEWDYTFEGWSNSSGGSILSSIPFATEDTTYYAIVTSVKQQYTLTFEVNGGSSVTALNVDYGTSLTELTESTKEGYNFTAWNTDIALTTPVTLPLEITEDITLYASWNEITFDITWVDENGTNLSVDAVPENGVVSHTYNPTDTAEWDYTFEGWSDSSGGSILSSIPLATEDTTYYAIVTSVKQQYTLTFEVNGGSSVTALNVDYGTSLTELTESTKEGYNFTAWNTDVALTTPVTLPLEITEDITLYASWNEKVEYATYLQSLLSSYTQNPYSELPDSMLASNFVPETVVSPDYTSFVTISDINYHVFGEQWEMILGNMDQTSAFSNLLSVVEVLSTTSLVAYNNFLDSNPANTEYYQFEDGIYTITIEVSSNIIKYSVNYTGNVPVFGEQEISIELTYNFVDETKMGRIQAGDNNVLQYTVSEDRYEFAISYLGVRDAYFEMDINADGTVEGNIFEYLTYNDYSLESAAQFLIDDSYVYVVGNKASGMPGFDGTIVEVYDIITGDLIGYEVQEELSLITFNTLWFKLEDQTGIINIKLLDVTNGLNTSSVYVNNSSDLFESQNVGGFLNPKQATRRYDIELRTVYYYIIEDDQLVKVKTEVPMLFVQEEVLDDLETDVASNNASITTFTLDILESDITLIKDSYVTYVPIFQTIKDNMSYEDVQTYLGLTIE